MRDLESHKGKNATPPTPRPESRSDVAEKKAEISRIIAIAARFESSITDLTDQDIAKFRDALDPAKISTFEEMGEGEQYRVVALSRIPEADRIFLANTPLTDHFALLHNFKDHLNSLDFLQNRKP